MGVEEEKESPARRGLGRVARRAPATIWRMSMAPPPLVRRSWEDLAREAERATPRFGASTSTNSLHGGWPRVDRVSCWWAAGSRSFALAFALVCHLGSDPFANLLLLLGLRRGDRPPTPWSPRAPSHFRAYSQRYRSLAGRRQGGPPRSAIAHRSSSSKPVFLGNRVTSWLKRVSARRGLTGGRGAGAMPPPPMDALSGSFGQRGLARPWGAAVPRPPHRAATLAPPRPRAPWGPRALANTLRSGTRHADGRPPVRAEPPPRSAHHEQGLRPLAGQDPPQAAPRDGASVARCVCVYEYCEKKRRQMF